MKFDVYGRFRLEVTREEGSWVAYRLEPGKRIKISEPIPDSLEENEIGAYLDDIYHEMARPNQTVRQIE